MAGMTRRARELEQRVAALEEFAEWCRSAIPGYQKAVDDVSRETDVAPGPAVRPAGDDVSRETSKIERETGEGADVSRETEPAGDVMGRARRARGGRGAGVGDAATPAVKRQG